MRKEHKRSTGVAMNDRFEQRHVNKVNDNKKKKEGEKGEKEGKTGKNELKSTKFFSKMQEVAKDDQVRKDLKRKARKEGTSTGGPPAHTNESTKKFKL